MHCSSYANYSLTNICVNLIHYDCSVMIVASVSSTGSQHKPTHTAGQVSIITVNYKYYVLSGLLLGCR